MWRPAESGLASSENEEKKKQIAAKERDFLALICTFIVVSKLARLLTVHHVVAFDLYVPLDSNFP